MNNDSAYSQRVASALKTQFVADALAMPVHWYYNPMDIEKAFPGGIQRFEAAPDFHPSSIMSLHSTSSGGRRQGRKAPDESSSAIVGDVILKGRAKYWDVPSVHYHQGMGPGENTLNAHCTRVLMRALAGAAGEYDRKVYLSDYIGFMTADPPAHPDTYAESYHRGFFANFQKGLAPEKCAMVTHDTPSVGGLVTVASLVFSQRLRGAGVSEIQALCREHVALTHPDESLMAVCNRYVRLLCGLMEGPGEEGAKSLLVEAGKGSDGLDVAGLVSRNLPDLQVVGRLYSSACYISDSWPVVLYLAYKYHKDPWLALRVNTNLGGDNVHRGMVLGALMGLLHAEVATSWFDQLVAHQAIGREIDALISAAVAPR
ncbi:ADP-ribosylglycohydrolase family protein [Marinobacter vulgaris]|uniref:ADP-ribosylglycohydrolase family protein n=1 Tax=Marinobacter vulgaris TaxID=1928331 RepID=A0A2V3ZHK0_9GAMM|nr:ADP-ribosylglycohydrolase family protein [Marinobacter vulgaris]PXX89627.1 ADP-ribosylglycohydrolase family protein [Marinobacter vulgaris]TSJ68615.1 ADP-ribosylglycohydrolase family protein [Marinobacter vulgaris]